MKWSTVTGFKSHEICNAFPQCFLQESQKSKSSLTTLFIFYFQVSSIGKI